MIRTWHGWTSSKNAPAYEFLLKNEIFKSTEARSIQGVLGIDLLSREQIDEVEYVTAMRFASLEAAREFAEDDYEVAVIPQEARKLLSRFDSRFQHYEVKVNDGHAVA